MNFPPHLSVSGIAWRGHIQAAAREVASEVPVAFVYDGGTEAVMMATPADLEDFAVGFSLNESVISAADDITELAIVEMEQGVELRVQLRAGLREMLVTRRRRKVGPVGCGLCGVESIADALPPLPHVEAVLRLSPRELIAAMKEMRPLQELNTRTQAVHAASFYMPGRGIVALREDVGRHNALDKLAGALERARIAPATGAILMTSRVSVELVQKAAMMGAGVLAAVSAPTALALRQAEEAGITIAGVVRDDGLEVFTHAERIADAA